MKHGFEISRTRSPPVIESSTNCFELRGNRGDTPFVLSGQKHPEMWKKTHMKIKPTWGREATRQLHCWHHPDACRKSGGRHRYRFYFPQNPRPHVYTSHYVTPNVTLIYDAAVVKHVACVKMSAPWGPVGRSRKGEKTRRVSSSFFLSKGWVENSIWILFFMYSICVYTY